MENQSSPPGVERPPAYPLPFTREQLQRDILNIILFEMRRLQQVTSFKCNFPGIESDDSAFWDASNAPAELGMQYKDAQGFPLACALEDQFDYGLYAVVSNRSEEYIAWDTIHTWVGAYLVDLSRSAYVQEWEGEGPVNLYDGIRRCLLTSELANARLVLESSDPFFHFSGVGAAKDDDSASAGELSIRQMAMLAGMEEMSLRSAISRKTQPVLEIQKDNRRTYIKSAMAREWLQAKGRYLPLLKGRTSADLDLSATRFDSVMQLCSTLQDRQHFIAGKAFSNNDFDARLVAVLAPLNISGIDSLGHDDLANRDLMGKLADLLELPGELLILRAKEAVLRTEIWMREYELKQLTQKPLS